MDTRTIIGLGALGILFWFIINRGMLTWYRRKEGTGHDVDMNTIGHRGSWSGGYIEPAIITKIERELKEQANDDDLKSTN